MALRTNTTPASRYWAFNKLSAYKQRQKIAQVELQLYKQREKLGKISQELPHDSALATKLRNLNIEFSNKRNRTSRYIELKAELNILKSMGKDVDVPFTSTAEKIKMKAFADIINNTGVKRAFDSKGNYDSIEENVTNAITPYINLLSGIKPSNFMATISYLRDATGEDITGEMIMDAQQDMVERMEARKKRLGG